MHIKDYLESLSVLRRPEFFDPAAYFQYPAEDIFTLGYEEEMNDSGVPVCRLHYCIRDDCRNIKSIDITEQWKYMQQLKEEAIDLTNAIDLSDIETAFLESILILDAITNYNYNVPFVDIAQWSGMTAIHAIVTNTDYSGEPVLPLFGNNIFLRDLVMEQMKFMAKRYIAASPLYHHEKATDNSQELFEEHFVNAVQKYHDITNLSLEMMKSSIVTGRRNQELDDFIEQISYDYEDLSSDKARNKRILLSFQELFLQDSAITEVVKTKKGYVVLCWEPSPDGGSEQLQAIPCETPAALLEKLLERYEYELVLRYTDFRTAPLTDDKRQEIEGKIDEIKNRFNK